MERECERESRKKKSDCKQDEKSRNGKAMIDRKAKEEVSKKGEAFNRGRRGCERKTREKKKCNMIIEKLIKNTGKPNKGEANIAKREAERNEDEDVERQQGNESCFMHGRTKKIETLQSN